jgi:hypothetical protein
MEILMVNEMRLIYSNKATILILFTLKLFKDREIKDTFFFFLNIKCCTKVYIRKYDDDVDHR